MVTERSFFHGTGRRKSAVARVRLIAGGSEFVVNGKPLAVFFPRLANQTAASEPLRATMWSTSGTSARIAFCIRRLRSTAAGRLIDGSISSCITTVPSSIDGMNDLPISG